MTRSFGDNTNILRTDLLSDDIQPPRALQAEGNTPAPRSLTGPDP